MARDLIERGGVRAVEAFATHGTAGAWGGGCAAPAGFLGHVGFRTHRPHPTTPRMRMDLRSAVTWKDEMEAALDRVLGAVRPRPVRGHPADPASRSLTRIRRRMRDLQAQTTNSSSSFRSAALGLAPTIDRTTWPPW